MFLTQTCFGAHNNYTGVPHRWSLHTPKAMIRIVHFDPTNLMDLSLGLCNHRAKKYVYHVNLVLFQCGIHLMCKYAPSNKN